MLIPLIAFFLGVFLAPVVRPLLRPLFVEIIRATIVTVDEVRRMSVQVRENVEDATAEVQAERAARQTSNPGPAAGPPPPASPSSPPAQDA